MNTLIYYTEDSYVSESTIINRYNKPEIAHRYVEMMKAYNEAKKECKALESKIKSLQKRYDKLYDNFEIFSGTQTVKNYIQ